MRAVIDEILEEGGWRLSEREELDCSTASARISRDEWDTNPFWEDVRTWQSEHLASPGGRPYSGTDTENGDLGNSCADFENPFACEHEHINGLHCLWKEQNGLFGECVDGGLGTESVVTMLAVAVVLVALAYGVHFAREFRQSKSASENASEPKAKEGTDEGAESTQPKLPDAEAPGPAAPLEREAGIGSDP